MSEIWRPSAARVADANLTRFIDGLNASKGLRLKDYGDLYAWSVEQPAEFWSELARFAGVRAEWGAGPAIGSETEGPGTAPRSGAEMPGAPTSGAQMPGARFFRTSSDTPLNGPRAFPIPAADPE